MPTTITTAELAAEARRLATAANVLRGRVTTHVDPVAASGARTAALALLDQAELREGLGR